MALAHEAEATPPQVAALQANLAEAIRGKPDALDLLVVALAAGGSVLMEDVPGVGKTTLAKALARSLDATFRRVQFTPDLLPADILGSFIYNPVDGEFRFRQGPIFCNVLLADEINRASPRTQSALLEAMSERQVTVEGTRHVLDEPFLVLATQNPVEYHGTYPLPEAQLDRFLMQLDLGYPDEAAEREMLYAHRDGELFEALEPVMSRAGLLALQAAVRRVQVEESVGAYIVRLVRATRQDARLALGVSPRASLMLFRAAQAAAYCAGRDYVLPDDVQRLAVPVLAHRLVMTPKARYGGATKGQIVREVVGDTRVPA